MKRWMHWGLGLSFGVLASAGLLATAAWQALKPAPDEWAASIPLGPWQASISVPAALHIATHPFTLRLLEGHTFDTRFGPLRWQAGTEPGTWLAVCSPCRIQMPALGTEAIRVPRAEFTVAPDAEMQLQGRFALSGANGLPLEGQWQSRIERQQAQLTFTLTQQPLARAFGLFAAEIPELRQAQINGHLSVAGQLNLPSRDFNLNPRIEGFRVAGLGTATLLNAQPACATPADGQGFGVWLPRAVIAAEDQRFYEHGGYDLAEIIGAWHMNQREPDEPALHGGSTLSQQLAKLIYTGDGRDHARKLRELLYAVEMDRTLGKARVLSLYLAMAPWGDGQCGAEAAARHFLHKAAADLSPIEAVWLATLLHNPDRELTQMARHGEVNATRVAWVADQLRPAPQRRHDSWLKAASSWSPPLQAFTCASAVSASQAALGH